MKSSLAFVGLLLASSVLSPANAAQYTCECQDTGYECDGYQIMKLELKGETASARIGEDPENDPADFVIALEGKYGLAYRPAVVLDHVPYATGNKTFPSLQVDKAISRDRLEHGFVRLPEMANDGSEGHVWEYECARDAH